MVDTRRSKPNGGKFVNLNGGKTSRNFTKENTETIDESDECCNYIIGMGLVVLVVDVAVN